MAELEHVNEGALGRLKPIGDDVPPEARLLAEELRTVYAGLGVSLRRCAGSCGYEPSAVSRYLSGRSVPPWEFVAKLLNIAARRLGEPTAQEVVTHLRRVHRRAVPSGQATHRVQELQHLLEEAEQEVDGFRAREAVAVKLLQERQQQVAAIEIQLRSVEAARGLDREEHAASMAERAEEVEELRAEKERLLRQVEALREELERAHQSTILADAKCEQLAYQLEMAESREANDASATSGQSAGTGSPDDAHYLEKIAELNEKIKRLESGKNTWGVTEKSPPPAEASSLVRPYYRGNPVPAQEQSDGRPLMSDAHLRFPPPPPPLPDGVDVADLWVLDPRSGEYVLRMPPDVHAAWTSPEAGD
ncbi:helix-turn-helix domain-containing protein [Streptomyces sp. NPDC054787]